MRSNQKSYVHRLKCKPSFIICIYIYIYIYTYIYTYMFLLYFDFLQIFYELTTKPTVQKLYSTRLIKKDKEDKEQTQKKKKNAIK